MPGLLRHAPRPVHCANALTPVRAASSNVLPSSTARKASSASARIGLAAQPSRSAQVPHSASCNPLSSALTTSPIVMSSAPTPAFDESGAPQSLCHLGHVVIGNALAPREIGQRDELVPPASEHDQQAQSVICVLGKLHGGNVNFPLARIKQSLYRYLDYQF
jgi:hypothetical protein